MLTRRAALGVLTAAPLAMAGCGCKEEYPHLVPRGTPPGPRPAPPDIEAFLQPPPGTQRSGVGRVIDVHGHFFNASDIPVRGFVAESVAHQEKLFGWVIAAFAPVADRIAERAPTAADEIAELHRLAAACGTCSDGERWAYIRGYFDAQTTVAARHVAEATRNTEFLRRYRAFMGGRGRLAGRTSDPHDNLSPDEVVQIVTRVRAPRADPEEAAEGFLAFLTCMSSLRARNIHEYIASLHRPTEPFGVDVVLDAMVDFDYWLDCPPRSPQQKQVELHALLAKIHGSFLRPLVAYNPWTDIEQNGASLERVKDAIACGFVGAKIYPAMGFFPAGNATTTVKTSKRRPDLGKLDTVLDTFFRTCAAQRIPVLAHGEHRNGRDDAHDAFGGPDGWRRLFDGFTQDQDKPVVSIGHFGGVRPKPTWTVEFARLMNHPAAGALYADIGYWDRLMCPTFPWSRCDVARAQLKAGLETPVGGGTAADRVMFGTDWFMVSQVGGWPRYPDKILESLQTITGAPEIQKILHTNAATCFGL
jgi:predicted TIM-barrel fold metal-dependent hydrolase